MSTQRNLPMNFVSCRAYEAVYHGPNGKQELVLELRMKLDRTLLLFTKVNDEEIRANSIQDFTLNLPPRASVSLHHAIRIFWEGVSRNAHLSETYIHDVDLSAATVALRLTLDDKTFETTPCDTLTEAVAELRQVVGLSNEWYFQTCHHCIYSYPAFPGPGGDDRDDLRCYRDAPPNAFAEVQLKGKFASRSALFEGHYFVNAFHTCAAWQLRKTQFGNE